MSNQKVTQTALLPTAADLPAETPRTLVLRETLVTAVKHAVSMGSGSGVLPALQNMFLEVDVGAMTITRTNLASTLRLTIPCRTTGEPWRAMVDARAFSDFVREMTADQIELAQVDTSLRVTAGSLRATIRGGNPDDYPQLTLDGQEPLGDVPAGDLRALIASICYAAAREGDSPLDHVHLVWGKNTLTGTTTDRNRMARRTVGARMVKPDELQQMMLPASSLSRLSVLIHALEDDALISVTASAYHVVFAWDNGTMSIGRDDGQPFPDVSRVIPAQHATTIVVSRAQLEAARRRAAPFTDGGGDGVTLAAAAGTLSVSARSQECGDTITEMPASVAGKEGIRLVLADRYLRDAVGAATTAEVSIAVNSPVLPVVVAAHGADEGFCLIMPMSFER